jgi:hypothetical protein
MYMSTYISKTINPYHCQLFTTITMLEIKKNLD